MVQLEDIEGLEEIKSNYWTKGNDPSYISR